MPPSEHAATHAGTAPAPVLPRLAMLPGAGGGLLPARGEAMGEGSSPTSTREVGEVGKVGEMFGAGAHADPMSTGDSRRRPQP